ncbi:MAG: sigma-70 family RNA polymerase sigma factor [Candidatus Melainabacteria bacterium]|nr:sigma-70 family RNA polymerase sigma factor [Candidatus Melainabacteria bacterium]
MTSLSPPTRSKEALRQLETSELVELAQQDNMNALEILVERHQKMVVVTLHQLLPERGDVMDLAQDVLLRMCRSIKSLRNPRTFKYWLNRIITNLFYDELRKVPRQLPTLSMDAAPAYEDEGDGANPTQDIPDSSTSPERQVLHGELDEKIRQAIADLPEQFRTMIVLREVQGLSYEEIASLTNTNLGTVKSRLARARLRLQEQLKPYLELLD